MDCEQRVIISGPAEQFSKCEGRSICFEVRLGGEGGGGAVVWLWTLKMVYLVPTPYFLIQLQIYVD